VQDRSRERETVATMGNGEPTRRIAAQSPALPAARAIFAPNARKLTPRCQLVLDLLSDGHSNKEIALRLGIAEATVKAYISRILVVLEVDNRTQAALLALRLKYGLPVEVGA